MLHISDFLFLTADFRLLPTSGLLGDGLLREHHIYPVIGSVEGLCGEAAAAPVAEDSIATGVFTVGQGVQRAVRHPGCREVASVEGIFSAGSKVGDDISCIRSNRNRTCKSDRLPS